MMADHDVEMAWLSANQLGEGPVKERCGYPP